MREMLFRGRETDGNWVKVSLIVADKYCCILEDENDVHPMDYPYLDNDLGTIDGKATPVIPETIGQYTGLTDKNGKKIFEGDIVKCKDYLEAKPFEFQGYVDFKDGSFVIVGDFMTHYRWLDYEVEIIGNIHDNPELLKEGDLNDN